MAIPNRSCPLLFRILRPSGRQSPLFLSVGIICHLFSMSIGLAEEFRFKDEGSGKFLALVRFGDSDSSKARLTLFESIEGGAKLVKRCSRQLVNSQPLAIFVSSNGRYFVTMDEANRIGITSSTVVIYDLESGENPAYALRDFIPKNVRRYLRDASSPFVGLRWTDHDFFFNEDNTKLVSNRERCIWRDYPFVVVDLPHRDVRVEPIPEKEPMDLNRSTPNLLTTKLSDETVGDRESTVPRFLERTYERHFRNADGLISDPPCDQRLEYDVSQQAYVDVTNISLPSK